MKNITFGEFLRFKRKEKNLGIYNFADLVGLSVPYISNMENGKRPAPARKTQLRIADILNLDEEEQAKFFDLAASTKREGLIPYDIAEYILSDQEIIEFLRTARIRNISGKELKDLIK